MSLLDSLAQGHIFDLGQPSQAAMPVLPVHRPGYQYLLHRRHEDSYRPAEGAWRSGAAGTLVMKEHAGTHIDALSHQAEHLRLHGDVAVTPQVETMLGFTRHGAEEIPPLVCPAVLLDMAAHSGVDELPPRHLVSAADLAACAERQGTPLVQGSVLLVRTGFGRYWRATDEEHYLAAAGMTGEASIWVARHGVRAVGADTMVWDVPDEVDPTVGCTLPGHVVFLVRHGIYIIENLYLEEIAAAQVHQFLFVCLPLKLVGATGSPVRPIALVLPN